ncbi:MAG: phosphoribosyl-ATP diphosphatase [Rhodospirillales bacterium]|nr:phosphoribosyl-ATP diphosphatase [Alphaproteobacteria bacterium]MCB9977565.1 phosphoribosyl-ATP diphosphatase [Rhodospirillales bacterium]
MSTNILTELYAVLLQRKSADPEKSYVSSLYSKGIQAITGKIDEEAKELIEEGIKLDSSPSDQAVRLALANESADLLFHMCVLLAHFDIPPQDVLDVLSNRFGTSGHEEKACRPVKKN